jgi:hypothetical protein
MNTQQREAALRLIRYLEKKAQILTNEGYGENGMAEAAALLRELLRQHRIERDELAEEFYRLRAATQQARAALSLAEPALELGLDALRESADRYHAEMAGYRAWMHAAKEDDYTSAEIAWKAVREALKETP